MSDRPFLIRNLLPGDLPHLKALQERYLDCYPGASVFAIDRFQSEGFPEEENIFCGFLPDERLIGYAALTPRLPEKKSPNLPNTLWMEIKVDPHTPFKVHMRAALLDCLVARGASLVTSGSSRSTQLIFPNYPIEDESIEFLFARGFVHTESVYTLSRDLTLPIPNVLPPPGMETRHCRQETEGEQIAYVNARNAAFPESPISLEDWQHFTHSPLWQSGTCLAIYDGDELAGSIALYWDDAKNQASNRSTGITENLFVLPRWRGLGLGRYLVAQGLLFLKKQGFQEARLEVKSANVGALGLYTKLNYRVEREQWHLVNTLYDII